MRTLIGCCLLLTIAACGEPTRQIEGFAEHLRAQGHRVHGPNPVDAAGQGSSAPRVVRVRVDDQPVLLHEFADAKAAEAYLKERNRVKPNQQAASVSAATDVAKRYMGLRGASTHRRANVVLEFELPPDRREGGVEHGATSAIVRSFDSW